MRLTYRQYLREASRTYLQDVLEECGGCVTTAAKMAGVNRTYFHRLLVVHKVPGYENGGAARRGNAAWRELGY